MQGVQVHSLGRELRSHMLCSQKKKKKKENEWKLYQVSKQTHQASYMQFGTSMSWPLLQIIVLINTSFFTIICYAFAILDPEMIQKEKKYIRFLLKAREILEDCPQPLI